MTSLSFMLYRIITSIILHKIKEKGVITMTKYELYKSIEKTYKRNYLKSIPLIFFDIIKYKIHSYRTK